MKINKLFLNNFRSWNKLEIIFKEGITALIADNGSGKTNIVESIYYLSTLQSHRNSDSKQLIEFTKNQAIIKGNVSHETRELIFETKINLDSKKEFFINNNLLKKQSEYLGFFKTVIFSPEDISVIKGNPSSRRKLFDEILLISEFNYANYLKNYEKVLKQKNSLLKNYFKNDENFKSTLNIWNEKLANLGAEISHFRLNLINLLNPIIKKNYEKISKRKDVLSIQYNPEYLLNSNKIIDIEKNLQNKYLEIQNEEISRRTTLIGPHRDDFTLNINNKPIKYFSSHGEIWSSALALKLSIRNLHQNKGFNPVVILDDVFAELDSKRRKQLIDILEDSEQIIITTAVESDIPDAIKLDKIFLEKDQKEIRIT